MAVGTDTSAASVSSRRWVLIDARKLPIERSDARATADEARRRSSGSHGLPNSSQRMAGRIAVITARCGRTSPQRASMYVLDSSAARTMWLNGTGSPYAVCVCPSAVVETNTRPAIREANSSGRRWAYSMMVIPPSEWPTSTTGPSPAVSRTTAARSSPSWASVASRRRIAQERPCPRASYATTRAGIPIAAGRSTTWRRQMRRSSVQPCRRMTVTAGERSPWDSPYASPCSRTPPSRRSSISDTDCGCAPIAVTPPVAVIPPVYW
jgi:hypothetical protein